MDYFATSILRVEFMTHGFHATLITQYTGSVMIVIIAALCLVVLYRLLYLFLPQVFRSMPPTASSSKVARVRKSRYDEGAQAYWQKAETTADDLREDMETRYGPNAKTPGDNPPPSLAARFRAQWPILLICVLLLVAVIVIAAAYFW